MKILTKSLIALCFVFLFAKTTNAQTWNLAGNSLTTPGTDYLGTTDSKALIFKTAATERMQLSASGNLRLGAPVAGAPGAKLSFNDVSDAVNGLGNDGITWYSPTPLNYGIYKTAGSWTSPNYQQLQLNWLTGMILKTDASYSKGYVDVQGGGLRVSSGNVGIGTLSPAAKLEIQTNAVINNTSDNISGFNLIKQTTATTTRRIFMVPHLTPGGFNSIANEGDCGIFWTDGSGSGSRNVTAGFVIASWQGGTDLYAGMRITAHGNVGICSDLSTNPSDFKLIVAPKNTGSGTGSGVLVQNNSGAAYSFKAEVADNTVKAIVVENAGVENFKVLGNGNVFARSVKITLATFPDYVFDKEYKLLPMGELEQFIQQNKHLPSIPTAKEIENNGADLGELVKLQMQKIEELTLYILQQNKRIENLEKNVSMK